MIVCLRHVGITLTDHRLIQLIQSSPFVASYEEQGGARDLLIPGPPVFLDALDASATPCPAILRVHAWMCEGPGTNHAVNRPMVL